MKISAGRSKAGMKSSAALLVAVVITMIPGAKNQVLELSMQSLVVTQPGKYNITCGAIGLPNSTVEWSIGIDVVSDDTSATIHQLQTVSQAVLILYNPVFVDEGTYTCRAYQNRTFHMNNSTLVKVPSKPTIHSFKLLSCNGTSSIQVESHKNAAKIPFRIVATSGPDNIEKSNISQDVGGIQNISIALKPLMSYNLTVSPCFKDFCSSKYAASVSATTSPTTFEPVGVYVIKKNESCYVTWSLPLSGDGKFVDKLEVEAIASFIFLSPRMNSSNVETGWPKQLNVSSTSYSISTSPNRVYNVSIRASACAKWSQKVLAIGDCSADFTGPTDLRAPVISFASPDFKKREINLTIPNENNGPIRCLFVIAAQTETKKVPNSFTITTLDKYNSQIASHNDIKSGKFYIALAKNLSSLNSTSSDVDFTLGERTEVSKCRLNSTVYKGQPWQLTIYKHYSLYVVSATVTQRGEVIFRTSNMTTFRNDNTESGAASYYEWIIAGVVVAVIIVVLVYCRWSRRKIPKPRKSVDYTATESVTGYSTLPRTLGRGKSGVSADMRAGGHANHARMTPSRIPAGKSRAAEGGVNTLARKHLQVKKSDATGYPAGYHTLPNMRKQGKGGMADNKNTEISNENARSNYEGLSQGESSKNMDGSDMSKKGNASPDVDLGTHDPGQIGIENMGFENSQSSKNLGPKEDTPGATESHVAGDLGQPRQDVTYV